LDPCTRRMVVDLFMCYGYDFIAFFIHCYILILSCRILVRTAYYINNNLSHPFSRNHPL
jgi:hypothetical protein